MARSTSNAIYVTRLDEMGRKKLKQNFYLYLYLVTILLGSLLVPFRICRTNILLWFVYSEYWEGQHHLSRAHDECAMCNVQCASCWLSFSCFNNFVSFYLSFFSGVKQSCSIVGPVQILHCFEWLLNLLPPSLSIYVGSFTLYYAHISNTSANYGFTERSTGAFLSDFVHIVRHRSG